MTLRLHRYGFTLDRAQETGAWLASTWGRRFIWADGRLFVALGPLRLRVVYGSTSKTPRAVPHHTTPKKNPAALSRGVPLGWGAAALAPPPNGRGPGTRDYA